MAYLFQIILLLLLITVLLTPVSFALSYNENIKLTVFIPFLDLTFFFPERRKKRKKRKIKKRLKNFVRTVSAYKRSLDMLLKKSRLTVYDKGASNAPENALNTGRSIIFSVFLSYLASKSGILITDGINFGAKVNVLFSSALIETRAYRVIWALITFLTIRFFPKKEQGIVR